MAIISLVTYATVARRTSDSVDIDLRHVALTDDGSEVEVLVGRGFGLHASAARMPNLATLDLEADVRACVGPDEPIAGQTAEEAQAAHWRHVASRLSEQGIAITADEAQGLPHEVVLPHDLTDR